MTRSPLSKWFTAALVVLFGSLASNAQAAPITIDFQSAPAGAFQFGDYVEDGVTMSLVSGHYDILFNSAGLYAEIDSTIYGPAAVSFSMGGNPFNLLSIDFIYNGDVGTLTTSNGTVIPLNTTAGTMNFALNGITSFTLAHGWTTPLAFDNLVIEAVPVPEPAMLLLLGIGAAGAYVRRRV